MLKGAVEAERAERDAYMIAQAGAVLRLPVLYLPRRPAARLALFSCWQSIALVAARHRNLAFRLTLAASTVGAALAFWALMDRQEAKPDPSSLAPVLNETVVYRQATPPQPDADQESLEHPYSEQVEASDELDDDNVNRPSNFPRAVQIVRFVKPDVPPEISKVTSLRESRRSAIGDKAKVAASGGKAIARKTAVASVR